jgi:uncharacterized membrane protein (UPF0127 family)
MNPSAARWYALALMPVVIAVAIFSYVKHRETGPTVRIGNRTFSVEIADTAAARERGLSDRDTLCADCAMLFRFGTPGNYRFWMKGMRFSLDFAWIAEGRVIRIDNNVPADSRDILSPPGPVTEVLETNAGALSEVEVGEDISISVLK